MSDVAIQLLILEGLPLLALVFYLGHKKRMYILEKGINEKDDAILRSERRIINGIFLALTGCLMIAAPGIATLMGIEASLTFELILASLVVLCAGIAMLIGGGVMNYRARSSRTSDGLADLK
jgi:hypothetical protein